MLNVWGIIKCYTWVAKSNDKIVVVKSGLINGNLNEMLKARGLNQFL